METFVLAHASAPTWTETVGACISQLSDVPQSANLGFLYVTDRFANNLPDILHALRDHSGVADWVGTVGVGICVTDLEYMDQPAVAVLLATLPEHSFCIVPTIREGGRELTAAIAGCDNARFGIVHGDPYSPQTPQLVQQLAQQLDGGYLVGGLTSSRSENPQIANEIGHGGISGVIFREGVAVTTALTQGCSPIGAVHRVTDCQHNIISSIDERPALDVFTEEIGEILARDLHKVAGYIFAARPVIGSDIADYTVRNIVGIDPRNKLIAVGDRFNPGESILFCRRDSRTARDDMLRMLRHLKQRVSGRTVRGAVYYTCLGRGQHMFGKQSEELRFISRELGATPIVGFFANGEISHDRIYGYTGVLTLFL